MLNIRFYESIDDELLKFAVIISRFKGNWVLCNHRERTTYEWPGGHREQGENIIETAKRELYEETGAVKFQIRQMGIYSVQGDDGVRDRSEESFGMLFFAEIDVLEEIPAGFEIERIEFFSKLPENNWTYPEIQLRLMEQVAEALSII